LKDVPKPPITEPQIPSSDATIVYMGDSHPEQFGLARITELTKNFNLVVPQSPTGKVDAIVLTGDFVRNSMAQQAFADSNVKNIPIFWVMGNHEAKEGDAGAIRNLYSILRLPTNPGPNGTEKTTYSFNVGNIHVINMNEYWDGEKNDAWVGGGSSGGYVGTALYNWISNDLSKTSDWKVVVGHEPLYPTGRHVGNSLDSDKANRDKLQALFVSEKVSVFVSGHTHSASVVKHDTVYHVSAGVTGAKKTDSIDKFQSLIYTFTTTDNLVLTWKHENPTWSTPKIETYTISK
jgi:predicted phosphodiesterase